MGECLTFWGSHGCDRLDEHTLHRCGTLDDPCSEVENERVRYWTDEGWSEWFETKTFTLDPD